MTDHERTEQQDLVIGIRVLATDRLRATNREGVDLYREIQRGDLWGNAIFGVRRLAGQLLHDLAQQTGQTEEQILKQLAQSKAGKEGRAAVPRTQSGSLANPKA